MPRKPDPFDHLPEPQQLELMRLACHAVFGPAKGDEFWKGIEPSLLFKERQFGDARDPKENFWKGVWRIYEAE
jgi:hypothetical protein